MSANLNPPAWSQLRVTSMSWCMRCGALKKSDLTGGSIFFLPYPNMKNEDAPMRINEEPACKTPVVSQTLVHRSGTVRTLFEFYNPGTRHSSFTEVADGSLFSVTIGVQSDAASTEPAVEPPIDF